MQEEVADCAAVVVFFLLVAALPAGSYFFLHRNLVTRYEQLADTLAHQATEVGSSSDMHLAWADAISLGKGNRRHDSGRARM